MKKSVFILVVIIIFGYSVNSLEFDSSGRLTTKSNVILLMHTLVLCSQSEARIVLELNAIKSDSETNAQKIKVFVKNKNLVDDEEDKVRIAKAKVEQDHATALAFK